MLNSAWGGGNLPHAKVLWAQEMRGVIRMCNMHQDDLTALMKWEWAHSPSWIGCASEFEAERELTLPIVPRVITDLSNRFRRVCKRVCKLFTISLAWFHDGEVGTSPSWNQANETHPNLLQTTISVASCTARADRLAHANSGMNDQHIVNFSYNRALKVLT